MKKILFLWGFKILLNYLIFKKIIATIINIGIWVDAYQEIRTLKREERQSKNQK